MNILPVVKQKKIQGVMIRHSVDLDGKSISYNLRCCESSVYLLGMKGNIQGYWPHLHYCTFRAGTKAECRLPLDSSILLGIQKGDTLRALPRHKYIPEG